MTLTNVSGSLRTQGRRRKPLRRLKTLTLSAMPIVSVATIVTLSHLFLPINLNAKRISCQSVSTQYSGSRSRTVSLAASTLPKVRLAASRAAAGSMPRAILSAVSSAR